MAEADSALRHFPPSAAPARACCLTRNQLIKVALLSPRGGVLVQQRQAILVEFLEPLVPANVLQRISPRVAGEIQTQHPNVALAAGAPYACRPCAAFFCPLADLVVVGRDVRSATATAAFRRAAHIATRLRAAPGRSRP